MLKPERHRQADDVPPGDMSRTQSQRRRIRRAQFSTEDLAAKTGTYMQLSLCRTTKEELHISRYLPDPESRQEEEETATNKTVTRKQLMSIHVLL